jgi:hypothetical protein
LQSRDLIMSVSGISSPVPATALPVSLAAASNSPASSKPASASSAAQSAASNAVATVNAAAAALKEITETQAQTVKEAAGGDRVAQRILAKNVATEAARSGGSTGNPSNAVKPSAPSAVSAPGSIVDERA